MKISVIIGEDGFSREMANNIEAKFIQIKPFTFPDGEVKPILKTENDIKSNNILLVSRTNRFKPHINDSIMKIFLLCHY